VSRDTAAPAGTVYLLHFARELGDVGNARGTARHYIGWADDLDARLAEHRGGRGARILAACVREGIRFDLVRTWEGVGRSFERRLKNQKHAWRLCPVCRRLRPAPAPTGQQDDGRVPAGPAA
jgi:predicted GIY-YIG superfamily endonuclease